MTVGNSARHQFNMAQIQTRYGSELNSLYSSYSNKLSRITRKTGGSMDALNNLLKGSRLKNKSSEYKAMFSELYKNIYNISDDGEGSSDVSSLQSTKTASASAGAAAKSVGSFADSLKYGGEVNLEDYKTTAQNFVDSYNSMIEKVGNSDNQNVLRQGVYMVNQAKVYSSSLDRAGISLGSDNKLTLSSDLSKVSASDIKSTFGGYGFASKVESRARAINQYSGGSGIFASNGVSSSASSEEKAVNSGTLKALTEEIKKKSEAFSTYIDDINSGKKEFKAEEYNETAKGFIENYNKMLSEAENSDKVGVSSKGVAAAAITKSYRFALQRAGFNIDKNGRISLGDTSKVGAKDLDYAFKNSSYLEKITQKAKQVSSLANSASAMGYNANRAVNYAFETGAIYNVYA